MDIKFNLENLEPWYMTLNKKCYVPTILVHPNNKPIVESVEIVKYIDSTFTGTQNLIPAPKSTLEKRYSEFLQIREAWDVGSFTFGNLQKGSFILRSLMPWKFANDLDKTYHMKQTYPAFEQVYHDKILQMYH